MTAKEIARELFGAVKDAVQTVAPGLTTENIKEGVAEVFDKHSQLGASEIANALFSPNGSAFVLYPPDPKKNDGQTVGLTGQEEVKQQERGGMSM